MSSQPLVIHAPNVYQGGGRTLLTALLGALERDAVGHILLDARFEVPPGLPHAITAHRFPPTLAGRLRAESCLPRVVTPTARVLCFGTLPPVKRCRAGVTLFVQNRNIVSRTDISDYPPKQRLRITLERLWFRRYAKHVDRFIVQTETMHELLHHALGAQADVRIVPLVPAALLPSSSSHPAPQGVQPKRYDFCYISTGEPHKNHRRLVEAWILLARRQQFPSLCLTVSVAEFPQLHAWIAAMLQRHRLAIDNVGYVHPERIEEIYSHSRALVYPSLYESFGLPLLEARCHGLKLLAPERDYVRDVTEPDESFDPDSPRSIARAVQRSCHGGNTRGPLVDGRGFIERMFAA